MKTTQAETMAEKEEADGKKLFTHIRFFDMRIDNTCE